MYYTSKILLNVIRTTRRLPGPRCSEYRVKALHRYTGLSGRPETCPERFSADTRAGRQGCGTVTSKGEGGTKSKLYSCSSASALRYPPPPPPFPPRRNALPAPKDPLFALTRGISLQVDWGKTLSNSRSNLPIHLSQIQWKFAEFQSSTTECIQWISHCQTFTDSNVECT